MKFRKKPVVIEAYVLGQPELELADWFWDAVTKDEIEMLYSDSDKGISCEIKTLEGVMTANYGDYIIQGVQGEIYPCKAEIFEATYDVIEEVDE